MDVFQKIKSVPELNFLLLCACSEPNNIRQDRINKAADLSLNWDLIYELSLQHRMFPLIYKNIKGIIPDCAPGNIVNRFRNIYFENATKNLYFFAFLIKIIDLLKGNDIYLVPFKGPILAHDLYRELGLRQFSDLDILVSKKDAVKAWGILINYGFEPELNLNENQKRKYIESEDHIALSKRKICIELHWEISGIYISRPLILEEVSKRLEKIIIDNREFANLSPEHLLVYLCIHGSKHGWENLEPVCCVAELLKTKKNIDWGAIEEIVSKWQCKKMLELGLYLSWELLNAPVPDNILSKIKEDDIVASLGKEVALCMFKAIVNSNIRDTTGRFASFHIRIRDSFWDKMRYAFRLVFRPTDKEWLYYPVPASLSCLHYFLRPFRLLTAGLKGKNA